MSTLNLISIILLALSTIFLGRTNHSQNIVIEDLTHRANCLEQGRVYVGEGFCANKSL